MGYLLSILPSIQNLGLLGYWIVLFAALLESLVLIGAVIPGALFIVFMGFLSGQGYLDIGDMIWFAAFGAIIGDGISFYMGTKGTRFFRNENKLLKLSHLEKAEKFFKKHGNKSIFWGRFIGPLRSIIPFVAGLSKMNRWSFLFWNVISAFLWSAAHLFTGYFFGGAVKAIEVWSTRAGFFLLFIFLISILIWMILKRGKPFFNFIKSILVSVKNAIVSNPDVRKLVKNHSVLFPFIKKRFDKKIFSGLPLTLLIIAFIYTLSLFLGTIQDIINSEQIVAADFRVANLLFAFRDTELVRLFLWITLLAKLEIVASGAVIITIICLLWRRRNYIIPLWTVTSGAAIFSYFGKLAIHRHRPEFAVYNESTFSFPSGHATLAVAFYGFIAYLLLREVKNWKYKINILSIFFILAFAIGLSRLYLGVHFLSDVWGGYLLGFLWLIIGISISEWLHRRSHSSLSPVFSMAKTKTISTALIIIYIFLYFNFAIQYNPPPVLMKNTEREIINNDILTAFQNKKLPRYTETIIGENQEPLNFIIVANDDQQFIDSMESAGWHLADRADFASVIRLAKSALFNANYPTAPMTPSFWNAGVHDFGFEKPTEAKSVRERHHVRFWRTLFETTDGGHIYVGTASMDIGVKWFVTHRIKPDIDTEREYLFEDLEKSSNVSVFQRNQFVEPILGENFSGDQFFTDGKLYVIFLKGDSAQSPTLKFKIILKVDLLFTYYDVIC